MPGSELERRYPYGFNDLANAVYPIVSARPDLRRAYEGSDEVRPGVVAIAHALGYSLDTPLAAWYTHIRSQRLVDGPDEVHKWITGKNVIRAFKKDGTTAAACGGDLL